MEIATYIILFSAAAIGGGINAVAGGGTFLVFPILLLTGASPIQANATNTMALWPGSVASCFAFREKIKENKSLLPTLLVLSLLGGAVGAVLLLKTPESTFRALIPWLLLVATVIFTFGHRLMHGLHRLTEATPHLLRLRKILVGAMQFSIGVYGGYFGAGIGILMLAMLQLMGLHHIHQMNAIKNLLAALINAVAVLIFILSGLILWPQGLVMLCGSILGGFAAGHYSQKLSPMLVRKAVTVYAWGMTAYFFWKI